MTEADVLAVLQSLTGRSWEAELQAWVAWHAGTARYRAAGGPRCGRRHRPARPRAGTGPARTGSHSVLIKQVLRGGLAEQAGMMAWGRVVWHRSRRPGLAPGQARRTEHVCASGHRLHHGAGRTRQTAAAPDAAPAAGRCTTVQFKLSISDEAAVNRWLSA
jgi:hypothetical protein